MKQLSPIRQIILIAALVLLWGVSFPINKMMLQYTPPLLFAGMRTLAGAILLVLFLLPKRQHIQWKRHKHVYIISSLLNVVLFFGLQIYGLKMMSSGLFSVLVYLQPVLVALFAWIWLGEQMSVLKAIGLGFGILGVAAISTRGEAGHMSGLGVILGIGTSVSWALGTVYVKRVSSVVHFMWLAAMQCMIGGIILIFAGSLVEPWNAIHWSPVYWAGMGYSSILGVAGSWILYFTLVRSGEASVVTSYTFLVPIVSVLAGMLFLHESFTLYLWFGLIFIGISIGMVNLKPKSSRMKPAEGKVLNKFD